MTTMSFEFPQSYRQSVSDGWRLLIEGAKALQKRKIWPQIVRLFLAKLCIAAGFFSLFFELFCRYCNTYQGLLWAPYALLSAVLAFKVSDIGCGPLYAEFVRSVLENESALPWARRKKQTIGQHLRREGLKLGLLMGAVAALVGLWVLLLMPATVWGWINSWTVLAWWALLGLTLFILNALYVGFNFLDYWVEVRGGSVRETGRLVFGNRFRCIAALSFGAGLSLMTLLFPPNAIWVPFLALMGWKTRMIGEKRPAAQ